MGFRNPVLSAMPSELDTGGDGPRVRITSNAGDTGEQGGGVVELYPNTSSLPGILEAGTDDEGAFVALSSPPDGLTGETSTVVVRGVGPYSTSGVRVASSAPVVIDAPAVDVQGGRLTGNAPGGLIGQGVRLSTVAITGITAAVRIPGLEFAVSLETGRAYEVHGELRCNADVVDTVVSATIRLTPVGQTPTATDPPAAGSTTVTETAGTTFLFPLEPHHWFQVNTPGSYLVNLWVARVAGTGIVQANHNPMGDITVTVSDAGPARANTRALF